MVKDKEDIKEAMDKLEVLSKDQHLRRIAELREKAIRDEVSALAYATERGLEQGRNEGRNEGQKLKEIEIAKNMLKEGLEISLIEKVTGLTVEEIEKLKI